MERTWKPLFRVFGCVLGGLGLQGCRALGFSGLMERFRGLRFWVNKGLRLSGVRVYGWDLRVWGLERGNWMYAYHEFPYLEGRGDLVCVISLVTSPPDPPNTT